MVGNHQMQTFYGLKTVKTLPMWPKSEAFLVTHLINVYSVYEVDCVISISDNDQKPPIMVILPMWPKWENLVSSHKVK